MLWPRALHGNARVVQLAVRKSKACSRCRTLLSSWTNELRYFPEYA